MIHGAPITTQDHRHRSQPGARKRGRLLKALDALEARVVDLAGRDLRPTATALEGGGQSLLRTLLGRLDVLGALHDGRGYTDLLEGSGVLDLRGKQLRIIDLPTLIEIKSSTGRARDRLVVPISLSLAGEGDEGQ